MEEEILKLIKEQDLKIEKIYSSVEKMRKYFFWAFIISIAVIVIPIIALAFMIPGFLGLYSGENLGI